MSGGLSNKARGDLSAKIRGKDVLAAFDLLVDGMDEFDVFELSPNVLGQKKSLHFKSGKVSYFAFIANNEWLLWYFRLPGLRDGVFNFDELKSAFPLLAFSDRAEVEKLEAVLRIRSLQDAESVLSFVRSKVAKLASLR
ncbi:MAG: hypothetical protein V4586_10840 [Pseudomonadota bacterium]